ncbi:MAG: DUF3828 domain-containing protein [Caulobacter sp.]|nr:DUF3828 domain-containing protein [Caulobacter sp.]
MGIGVKMSRLAAALAVTVLVTGAAWAAPANDPLALVQSLYADSHAADEEPAAGPEDEPSIYGASLRALFAVDAGRDMNNLDFDWVSGGQDLPDYQGLKIVLVSKSETAARVRVTFRNYSDPRERDIDLVTEDGRWVIEDVYLKTPEKAWLSRILVENRQD